MSNVPVRYVARIVLGILLASVPHQSTATEPQLLLFGGKNHDEFLGCLNCSRMHRDSIWNAYGKFGSEYQVKSIWNRYGIFGSQYNQNSPWNAYGTKGPVIVDANGNFYGYFSRNKFNKQTRIEWVVWILDNYDYVIEHLDKVREKF